MQFNDTKFELLRYGANQNLKDVTAYVSNTGKKIAVKHQSKDLGVAMSSTADFKLILILLLKLSEFCPPGYCDRLNHDIKTCHAPTVEVHCYSTPGLLQSTLEPTSCTAHNQTQGLSKSLHQEH